MSRAHRPEREPGNSSVRVSVHSGELSQRSRGSISLADQKRGFEGVLCYQDMSRVCPGCPQTTPRKAREGSWIRKPYGEYPGGMRNAECGMRNSRTMPPKAISKPPRGECRM